MHPITSILTIGAKQLELDPTRHSAAGLPVDVYKILVENLTGKPDGKPKDLITDLATLPLYSEKLNNLSQVYKILKSHSEKTRQQILVLETATTGSENLQQAKNLATNFLPQQIAFASLTVNLPPDQQNQKFTNSLGEQVLQTDLAEAISANKLPETLQNQVQTAAQKTQTAIPQQNVTYAVQKTVTNFAGKPAAPNLVTKIGLISIPLMVLASLANTPDESDPALSYPEEQDARPESPVGTLGATMLLFAQLRKQKNLENAEKELQANLNQAEKNLDETQVQALNTPPPPTPTIPTLNIPSIPSVLPSPATRIKNFASGLPNIIRGLTSLVSNAIKLIGNIASLFPPLRIGKILGGIFKFLGGKLLSLGGLIGTSQGTKSDSLIGSKLLLILIIIPFFLIIIFVIFENTVRSSAIVTSVYETNQSTLSPMPFEPVPLSSATPLPNISISPIPTSAPFPTSPVGADIPSGFPIASSCVTRLPGGSLTHRTANAVDIGAIAAFNAWYIHSTHAGRVIYAGNMGSFSYGWTVILESIDQEFITWYAHMAIDSIAVNYGDIVERGHYLGYVDDTGNSTGNHLHYELRGPRSPSFRLGSKDGPFGRLGSILDFLPDRKQWKCRESF